MSHAQRSIVLYETHQLRQLLYANALEHLGTRVVMPSTTADAALLLHNPEYVLAVVSLSEDAGERRKVLSSMQRATVTIPMVILDAELFNPEHFESLPVQAHFHRSRVNLSEVISHIARILHVE